MHDSSRDSLVDVGGSRCKDRSPNELDGARQISAAKTEMPGGGIGIGRSDESRLLFGAWAVVRDGALYHNGVIIGDWRWQDKPGLRHSWI